MIRRVFNPRLLNNSMLPWRLRYSFANEIKITATNELDEAQINKELF
jgi:hypothetical protein